MELNIFDEKPVQGTVLVEQNAQKRGDGRERTNDGYRKGKQYISKHSGAESGGRKGIRVVEKSWQKIGKLRLRSRESGEREATPDQDDIMPCDGEGDEDIGDVLKLTGAREAKLREEMGIGKDNDDGGDDVGSESDEVVTFGVGSSNFSARSRKEAKKSRRPNFERSRDGMIQTGSLTHAGTRQEGKGEREAVAFHDLGVSELLVSHLEKMGFSYPTTVQKKSIPVLMVRKNPALLFECKGNYFVAMT